jgi:5'-nucleotidase
MAKLLITNDDGIDSPCLVPLVRAVAALGEVRVVVPSSERSWIGKAISRFDIVRVEETEREGFPVHAVDGSPADCVNLAVHTLFSDRPEWVVSGINLGVNFGLAFILSSGTVGAALEAWIAGVPAVAFSMAIPRDVYGLTGAHRLAALGDRPPVAAAVATEILQELLRFGLPDGVDGFSINLPADVTCETPRVFAPVTRSRYGRLFVPAPEGGYLHRFSGLEVLDPSPYGDIGVVESGAVAITPLRLDLSGQVPELLRRALERSPAPGGAAD